MRKISRDFFTGNEVLFIGYSSRNNRFCKEIFNAFANSGIKVYPVNSKANASFDTKVYRSLTEIPKVPKCAYVLLNRDNAGKAVKELAEHGVKKILFQNSKAVDTDMLNECGKMGIETAVGCPMMVFGSGLHKIHAFFAGVR